MHITCLTTGQVRPKRAERGLRRYLPGGWSDHTLPVNSFVIEHPSGICLFDTGQTARAAVPGYLPRWHPFIRLSRFELEAEDEVVAQLGRRGVAPDQVRWVVLSHLHNDHVGGLPAFVSSEVLVSRTEWERFKGVAGRLRGYVPGRWPSGLRPTLVDPQGDPVGPFEASHDVAGDGRLLLVPAPGHTPGHLGLIVRDGERSYLCAGDMVHEPEALGASDPEVEAFCHREGITVLTAHDPQAADRIRSGAKGEWRP